MAGFDVFLSHNSKDKPVVRQIVAGLRSRGINPWFDEEQLRPGLLWQDGLQEAIAASRTAAVCLGPDGYGDWEKAEIRALVQKLVKQQLPVIPVLLPGAPETFDLGIYLEQATWVDLRNGLTEEGLDRLYWGITGRKPEPQPRPPLGGPPLHNLPIVPLLDLFKGRDDDLRRLESALGQPGRAAAITQSEAISGLGGIGKTRLAVEHAWRCGHRYTAVFFIRADSPETLRRGLASLAGPTLLNLPERAAPAEEEVVAAVLRWLREHPGWLLILDNVDTEEAADALIKILPGLSGGRVLITSRLREWPPGSSPSASTRFRERKPSASSSSAPKRAVSRRPMTPSRPAGWQISLAIFLWPWNRPRRMSFTLGCASPTIWERGSVCSAGTALG